MLLRNKKSLRINTIRRAASKLAGVPGNLLINATNWFSSREWRNMLIGAGLSPDMTLIAFQGCTLNYETIEITQAELDRVDEATGKVAGEIKETINGREVTFKKPGVNNINLNVDFGTVNVTDSTLNLAKLSNMYPDRRNTPRPATTTVAPEQPAVAEPIQHEDLGAGEHTETAEEIAARELAATS